MRLGLLVLLLTAGTLPPVEAPYVVRVVSFRVYANGHEVAVPQTGGRTFAHTVGGYGSNALEAVLVVRAVGHRAVTARITFDDEAAVPTETTEGDLVTIRARKEGIPANRRVRIGYEVRMRPRVVTPTDAGTPFDPDIGITPLGASQLLVAVNDQIAATYAGSHVGCNEALRSYLVRTPAIRFLRRVGANIATNLFDLGVAALGGGPLGNMASEALKARAGLAAFKRLILEALAKIMESAVYNFIKATITEIIANGNFLVADVPREVVKDFVNAIFSFGIGSARDNWAQNLIGTTAEFVMSKVGDLTTDAAYGAAGAAGADVGPQTAPTIEAERLSQEEMKGVQDAEEEMKRKGMSGEYFRVFQDDQEIDVQGRRHRIRFYGVQWLVTGKGAILVLCDALPQPAGERRGYLIRFQGSSDGTLRLEGTAGGGSGIQEFRPTHGQSHDPESLTREVMGRGTTGPGAPAR